MLPVRLPGLCQCVNYHVESKQQLMQYKGNAMSNKFGMDRGRDLDENVQHTRDVVRDAVSRARLFGKWIVLLGVVILLAPLVFALIPRLTSALIFVSIPTVISLPITLIMVLGSRRFIGASDQQS